MTSNVGADLIKRQTGIGFQLARDEAIEEKVAYADMRKKLLDSLKRVFRPEFINRLDSVIVFRALSRENIHQIVSLEIGKVGERLHENEIKLTASPAAVDRLAEEGYDPDMGARPLRRVIQLKVEDRLSDAVLAQQFKAGDVVLVDMDPETDEIILKKSEEAPESEQPMGVGA
jgi:ATP-dependent Clp protease ATP-binding subunit ClpC